VKCLLDSIVLVRINFFVIPNVTLITDRGGTVLGEKRVRQSFLRQDLVANNKNKDH
jgi:hypothetical protein